MARIPLSLGSYQARSIIANAQRSVNLLGEQNPPDSPAKFTYYPAPGTRALGSPPTPAQARCLYNATTNDLYAVIGSAVLLVASDWTMQSLGTIGTTTGICSMVDNGTTLVLVDGSPVGYQIDLITHVMTPISLVTNAPSLPSLGVYDFVGGTRVDILDGFIITNDAGTRAFRSTYLNQIIWDSLWFADKNGYSDNLVAAVVQKREIWLIGERTTEIWFNAGLADFPFARMDGPFVQHGCLAPYSIACANGLIYWLSQDQNGKNVLARGEGYKATEISTPALVTEWSKYSRTDDAIGFCFQQNHHTFYQITFPTADKTWRFDETTGQWHEPVWIDDNGVEHRHRANCAAFAYGVNVVGDFETGQLLALDPETYTDNGRPMVWERGFPHLVDDGNRVSYPGFALDLEAGSALGFASSTEDLPMRLQDGTSLGLIGTVGVDAGYEVYLSWSDDRGRTYGNPVVQRSGTGEYLGQMQWSRLGQARDRVFRVRGTIPGQFALSGAWLSPEPRKSKS